MLPGRSKNYRLANKHCFALFVFLGSRDCCVAVPQNSMGLSAVCLVFVDHTHYFCYVSSKSATGFPCYTTFTNLHARLLLYKDFSGMQPQNCHTFPYFFIKIFCSGDQLTIFLEE